MLRGRPPLAARLRDSFELGEEVGVVIGLSADHDAIELLQELPRGVHRANPAVDDDLQGRKVIAQAPNDLVTQRGYLAIVLWRETAQHSLARMHDEFLATRRGNRGDECMQALVVAFIVSQCTGRAIGSVLDADPYLDGYGNLH